METTAPLPDFPFNRYIRYDELTALLQAAAKARPDLMAIESIGKSYEGRDIWCATLTNFQTGPADEKPAVYADGNIHATEVSPTTACTYLIYKLLSRYDLTHLGGKGYYDWVPFDHPDLGPVEIGGWDMLYAFRNPAPQFLESEVSPHADWLIWQSLVTPRLEVQNVEAKPLGDGVYQIRLVVENTGWLPSYVAKKALDRKVVRPVIAEIRLPEDAALVTGKLREELTQLEGRALKPAGNTGSNADVTDDRAKVEWVIRAPQGSTVTLVARHERAGTVRMDLTLP